VGEQQLKNDASGNRNQDVVAAGLHPVVTTRWRAQAVAAPVIDHIDAAAVLRRQSVATVKLMIGTGAAFVVFRMPIRPARVLLYPLALMVATILATIALSLILPDVVPMVMDTSMAAATRDLLFIGVPLHRRRRCSKGFAAWRT
jgi:hypothetical protein